MTELTAVAEGVWTSTDPVRFLGMRLTSNMTVIRLGDGSVLVHSPIALTPERRQAIEALGPVAHLYAPNLFHHLRIGDWAAVFPQARVHAPEGLPKKRPDLHIHRAHDIAQREPAFGGELEEITLEGDRMRETVLFHRPSRTLVVADLVHNIGRPEHTWTKLYTRVMGFYGRVGLSRVIRWTAFNDKVAARRSLDHVLSLPIERVIVGHGAPLTDDAKGTLAAVYAWLPEA